MLLNQNLAKLDFFKKFLFSGEVSQHSVNLLGLDTSSQEPTDVPKRGTTYSLALLPGSNCLEYYYQSQSEKQQMTACCWCSEWGRLHDKRHRREENCVEAAPVLLSAVIHFKIWSGERA